MIKSKADVEKLGAKMLVVECDEKINGWTEQIKILKDKIEKMKEVRVIADKREKEKTAAIIESEKK